MNGEKQSLMKIPCYLIIKQSNSTSMTRPSKTSDFVIILSPLSLPLACLPVLDASDGLSNILFVRALLPCLQSYARGPRCARLS